MFTIRTALSGLTVCFFLIAVLPLNVGIDRCIELPCGSVLDPGKEPGRHAGLTLPLDTSQTAGATYYVDQSNLQASDTNPGTEARLWKTITHAASVAVAGDTVYVKAGMYPERIHPAHSGSAGKRITFLSLPRRAATMWGFYTEGSNFLTIQGFNITTDPSLTDWTDSDGVFIRSDDVEVLDNYFYNLDSAGVSGYWHDPYPHRAHIANNTIYHSQYGLGITGYDWIVEYNEVNRLYKYGSGDADYSRFFGNNHIIRWNYFHGSLASEIGDAHVDCFQTFDNNGEFSTGVVIDGNRCSEFHQGFMGESIYYHTISHVTFKNNLFVNGWAWGLCIQDLAYVTAINNTFANIGYHGIGMRGNSLGGVVKNNIFYNMETSYWFESPSSIDGDYNLIFNAQDPPVKGLHDITGKDPKFVNTAGGDFHLQASSPAVDAGMAIPAVNQDYDRVPRPIMNVWDIGAFEYQPFRFGAAPQNGAIALSWQFVSAKPLPATVTWQINYTPANGAETPPIFEAYEARAHKLNGLSNYTLYTVTLTALDGSTTLYSASAQVMPSDRLVYMPVILR
ncbi:MAG TPA: right-handed parallel beta-helix repeat-containing protein [Anaerolineaceae bacterium]|nr:right-handed parallel beta-helix repeat-containing protein [Anaerolineaceae bacterium]